MQTAIELMERGYVPDWLTRTGIRRLLAQRLREEGRHDPEQRAAERARLMETLKQSPIALHADAANAQHYEVPASFFQHIMGRHLKYSACYWPAPVMTLSDAEAAMLSLTCERAQIMDGQQILELGCGWGSLTLWMAEHYPKASITAVSNSASQREFILARAAERGLKNLQVITADMNEFSTKKHFDRVVSVEMFEHMRNYRELLSRISGWLKPDGKLFVHIFAHRELAYPYEVDGDADWMARHFFTGGLMPSWDLLPGFDEDLKLETRWWVNGRHYQRTCEAWLRNQDRHEAAIREIFREVYGAEAGRWFQRWRVFFMACAELFGFNGGEEWGVAHYRFEQARAAGT